MIRLIKIKLVFLVAFWGLMGVLGNLAHLGLTYDNVQQVTSMTHMVEAGGAPPWANSNPVVIWLGVLLIVAGKAGALLFGTVGGIAMLRARTASAEAFQVAKKWAIVGCGAAVLMLFGGFTVIGETVFLMFFDPELEHAAQAAFRYGGFIALIMIFLAQRDEDG